MHNAGRVGFVPKGKYSATEIYDFLDVVTYNNSSYIAKKETTGNVPEEDNEYWQLMAKSPLSSLTIDTELSETSENPVQNKIVTAELNKVVKTGGGVHVGESPPEDTSTTWVDTSSGGIYKYYDESSETWKPVKSVWG